MKTIDIHTHGIGPYDTRTTGPGDILNIAGIHGLHGVSEIILSLYPDSVEAMRGNMAAVREAMERQDEEDGMQRQGVEGVSSGPARIIGIHLEGPFVNPLRCGALNPSAFVEATDYNLRRLVEGFEDVIRVVTIAPEIKGGVELIKKASDMGFIVNMGHSDATFEEAERGCHAGAKGVVHLFNAMRGFHHREPGIAGFGLLNNGIYVEIIGDPFHLHPATIEMVFRMKPHDRIIIVSDTVRGAEDPSPPAGLRDSSGGLLGGSMVITEVLNRLIESGLDPGMVKRCISENPERFLKGG